MVARGAPQDAFEDRPMLVDELIPSATAIRFQLLLDRVEHGGFNDGLMFSLMEQILVANQTGDSPRLADTGEMHLRSRGRLLFPCKFAWQRKTQCLQTLILRASIAPAITPGSVVFDAFLRLWSPDKAPLAHRSDAKVQ